MDDQVPRLARFEQDHPDIEIRRPDYLKGARLWSAHRDDLTISCQSELRELLDRLEWILDEEAKRRASLGERRAHARGRSRSVFRLDLLARHVRHVLGHHEDPTGRHRCNG